MLTFHQFLIESVKRAESAALVNTRGFISEYALKHSLDHYHNKRREGMDHEEALKSVARSRNKITKQTANVPEVHQISPAEFNKTVEDTHDHALHLIQHLHDNEGGISGPSVATGGMQSQTIKAHFGQETAADVLVPVNKGPHTHVGVSLKYSTSSKPAIIKVNTPGAGIVHEHLQDLHQKVFGKRNAELQSAWESFSPKLKGSVADPKSSKFIEHLKGVWKTTQSTTKVPPVRSLLRKASRGQLGDQYKFDYTKPDQKAATKFGEQARQAYNQAYSVKSDKDFVAYSGLAEQHLQKVFDRVAKSNNPAHVQAVHDFIHKITNTHPEEPKIKTVLMSIHRDAIPQAPVHTGSAIASKLREAGNKFSVSRKSHSTTINVAGMKITWARNDPARGNPVNISYSHLKGNN